jgi:Tol biopolymer transport system component
VNGRIYFFAYADPPRIMSLLPDGSDAQTTIEEGDWWWLSRLAVSPDGSRVLIAQSREGRHHLRSRLVIVDAADGGNLTVVRSSRPVHYASVAWAPSGDAVYFTRSRSGGYRLFSSNLEGTAIARIGTTQAFDIDVSPDGSRVAFTDRKERLAVMDIDGTDVSILQGRGRNFQPDWSPNGSALLFGRQPPGADSADLFTIAAGGSSRARLFRTSEWESTGEWAPDGTEIVFRRDEPGGGIDLFTMDAGGGGEVPLTNDPGIWESGPQWAPA